MTLEAVDRVIETLGDAPDLGDLPAALRPLVAALVSGPAPRESLLNLRRLLEQQSTARWPSAAEGVQTVARVLSSGHELGRLLARRPSRVAILLDPRLSRPRSKAELSAELRQRIAPEGDDERFALTIAAFRNDHHLRLAACEFNGIALEQVGLELANLADVCLDAAIDWATARLTQSHGPPLRIDEQGAERPCGLCAIAMGKYGAQELNFCSDIDLILIYASDQGGAGELSLHEFFTAVGRRVIRLLSQTTAEGIAFRVDLRLRPEGSQGPLCNALASAERYYETWGGPYDRLAWLKARAAAGDAAVGQQIIEILRPFVFPRALRPEIVQQVRQLTQRIRDELDRDDGWDVKVGEGGIRDVEFFVQALQLLHAGKQPALQERGTLRALDKLLFAGLIAEQEHRALAEAYEFYRRLEHRLQLHGGHQTHLLPADGALRRQVVAHLGLDGPRFAGHLQMLRQQVREIYATLGEPPSPVTWLARLIEDEVRRGGLAQPDAALSARLAAAGFTQPDRALRQLALLGDKPWGPFGRAPSPVARRVAEPLLAEVCRCPDPDAALGHLVELSLRFGPFDGLWAMLAEHPEALRLLCNLFGTSDLLARMFIDHPELLDRLLAAGHAGPAPGRAVLDETLSRQLPPAPSLDVLLEVCRRFRNDELLRIGLQDIAGDLTLEGVWQQLSTLADVLLARIYPAVLAEVVKRYGLPRHGDGNPATMAVIALGKLGGGELSYASDLDLIFVYSDEGQTSGPRVVHNSEFFARLAQRFINALTADLAEGRLYAVDTRLRPSGNQGTLVVSHRSLVAHHQQRDEVWQRQTLTKARAVAGDAALGATIERWATDYLYAGRPHRALAREVHAMRQRLEQELAEEKGDFYNLKVGRGGLLDVEFVAQYLQLCHGGERVELRGRSTLAVLYAARDLGLLGAGPVETLVVGYRFLRRLESRLRIVRDRSDERLPANAQGLEVIARRLSYRQRGEVGAGQQLLEDYRRQTTAIRSAYEEILGRSLRP